jgi:hypothetical protein
MKERQVRLGMLCAVFAVILSAFINSYGQEFRGTITGNITDPNGAAIPGATVIVKNIETNISTTLRTNDDGSYTAPLLLPGRYSVSVTGEGFKTSLRENVELKVDDRLTIDFALEIGTQAEVNVVAETEILERGTVTTGTVVSERQITELPLSEGAAYNLATQAPGVSYTGNPNFTGPTANGNLAAFRTNGAVGGNQITLDGSPNGTIDGGVAYTPPADALSQFKIQTNAFDAQSGFTAGSTVNVAVKSGTNKFHGSAYYFDRSKIFTANNFFSNRAGVERPDRKYYRYGGQINGPVILPYYNGRDKTFFMFSYEKQYNKRPEPEIFTVPTAAFRTGNFASLLGAPQTVTVTQANSCAGPVGTVVALTNRDGSPALAGAIYDPATALSVTRCNPLTGTVQTNVERLPFAGNIIPTARINPAALQFLNLYPTPNQAGIQNGTVDNYFSNQTNIQPYDSYLTRIDHNINDNNRIFGKFFWSKSTEDRYNWLDTDGSITQGYEIRRNIGGSMDYTTTLSSNFVLDIRGSYNNFVQDRIAPNAPSAADLGFTGIAAISESTVFPRFDFTNYDTLGAERADFNEGLTRTYRVFSLQPTLTQIFGDHTLKYGYDFRRIREDRESNGYNAGRFLFNGAFTSQASNTNATIVNQAGRDLASFLLGIPAASAGGSFIEDAASYDVSELYHGFFVQDDWRLSQRLTLNLGLRYELETGLRERNGQFVIGFDQTSVSPLRAGALTNYAANVPTSVPITAFQNLSGGLQFATGADQRNQAADKNNFQPRIGVSYALDDKTVLRGGFGIFTAPFQIQPVNQAGFTANTVFTPTTNNGLTFLANLNNPFPNGLNPAVGAGLGLNTLVGTTLGTTNASGPTETTLYAYDRKNANYVRFIAGIQRQLPWNIGAEATFVYSKGQDLPVLRQLNYIPREYLNDFTGVDPSTIAARIATTQTFLNQTVPNPFRGLVPQNATLNGNTIQRRFLLTQYPQFQDVIVTEYNGTSDYRSLQLQLTKRMSQGISFNASYTYSHDRESTRRLNPQDEELTSMISPLSRPHRFAFSTVFELPVGRKRAFLGDIHPVLDAFIGGWQLNAVFERQSGEPLVLPNVYYGGNIEDLEVNIGGRSIEGRRLGVDVPAFDISGFRINGVVPGFANNYTISSQNVLRTLPYTSNNIRNQPFQKFDLGLTKNFAIREGMKLQVRVEAINALNWVYFSGIQLAANNASFGFVNTQRNLPRDIQLGARFTF